MNDEESSEFTLTMRLDNSDGRFMLVPEVGQMVMVTVTERRPWWRRLLRMPARTRRDGPYTITRDPEVTP